MSMSHKAYVFDLARFDAELWPVLESALASEATQPLAAFIDAQRSALCDPYRGAALGADWRSRLEAADVQEHADFALTKYYDPADDLGLGDDWQQAVERLQRARLPESILLGTAREPLDPGRMGTYFQSPAQAREHLAQLRAAGCAGDLPELARMLRLGSEQGLLVTF